MARQSLEHEMKVGAMMRSGSAPFFRVSNNKVRVFSDDGNIIHTT